MSYYSMLLHANRQKMAGAVTGRHFDLPLRDDIQSGEDVLDQPDTISLEELARMERRRD